MNTSWNQQQQAYWPPPPPPQRGSGRGTGNLLIGVALGVVITLVVATVLLLTKAMSFGSTAAAAQVDTRPISLPATLGTVIDQNDALDARGKGQHAAKNSADRRAISARTHARTAADYQAAFGGSAVAVRDYADSGLTFVATVIAVRAPSPVLLIGPDPDPKDLGMALSQRQSQIFGDVDCLVTSTQVVAEGEKPDPERQLTAVCRRSGAGLTVYTHGAGNGPAGQRQMIALTSAAFEEVSAAHS
ncbi:MAG: hypothetical protein M3Z00_07615 [Actinomycetota bacterium]|nr:hypothetical protein [Actinomycetota bacterium]